MKNKRPSNEFNLRNASEFNCVAQEGNSMPIENNYNKTFSRQEDNPIREKPKRKSLILKLISTFVVLCAATAMIQTTFEIPIFSRIFSPPQSSTEVIKTPICSLSFDGVNEEIPYGTDGHYKYPSHEKISSAPPVWADYRYLHVHINMAASFPEYESIYFKMINITESVHTETGTMINKTGIEDGSYFSPRFDLTAPQQSLKFMIYVQTDNPDDFEYTETFSPDGVIIYYLIYVHEEIIVF